MNGKSDYQRFVDAVQKRAERNEAAREELGRQIRETLLRPTPAPLARPRQT